MNSTLILDGVSIVSKDVIIRQGNIILNGIFIDDEHNIIFKESNLRKDWSRKRAEQDALDAIFRELNFFIIEKSKLKGVGFIEINSLIEKYREKETKGIYEESPKEKFKDREIIFETADKYGIHYDTFAETLNKTNNPSLFEYYLGIIGNISTLFSIFCGASLAFVIIVNKIKWNIPISQSLKDEFKELLSIKKIKKKRKVDKREKNGGC